MTYRNLTPAELSLVLPQKFNMSRIRPDQLLLPSVFDRLLDFDPTNRFETNRDRTQLLRDLKMSVRRDLENLLNTRVGFHQIPRSFRQLEKSMFNYGVHDASSAVLDSSKSLQKLCQNIEDAIRRYETRFQSVRVELDLDSNSKVSRVIRFVIYGVLFAEPAPEPVTFSSKLNTIASEFRVEETS